MSFSEPRIQSFVIKIWLEDTTVNESTVAWHGHITHVPSRIRRYFNTLDDMNHFIRPYLARSDDDSAAGNAD